MWHHYTSSGNRWKAQVQLKQVSYYAGTYDTELEAAREFDKRARKEGAGDDFKYNFDENGKHLLDNASLRFLSYGTSSFLLIVHSYYL